MVAPRSGKINIPKMDNKPGGANPQGEPKAQPAAQKLEPKNINPEGKRATVIE
jgi:hypothetical protein